MEKTHPLENIGLSVANFKCFGDTKECFPEFKPINVIVGRNNVGKSTLIDAIKLCMGKNIKNITDAHTSRRYEITVSQVIGADILESRLFNDHHRKALLGKVFYRKLEQGGDRPIFRNNPLAPVSPSIEQSLMQFSWPFRDLSLCHIAAERNIVSEPLDNVLNTDEHGAGITNLVRAYLHHENLSRAKVEEELLSDLNVIYRGDSKFTRITCRHNDKDLWEIFLCEEHKGEIRLSQSGSSLKSIFIILCLFRLTSEQQNIAWDRAVLAIEEPENNLHPALLSRLLDFLAIQRNEKSFTLILTTHSPVTINWSAKREESQIIHVQHDGKSATVNVITDYNQHYNILEDLGARASDILQANGIIWVEGPSDRIYLRRWLELASGGTLNEGTHYSILPYGGDDLKHLGADNNGNHFSILKVNRNVAILVDSERKSETDHCVGPAKQNAIKQIEELGGFIWITKGCEVENYTPQEVHNRILKEDSKPLENYEFLPAKELPMFKKPGNKKVKIALQIVSVLKQEDIESHLDLWPKLLELCDVIRKWNGMAFLERS